MTLRSIKQLKTPWSEPEDHLLLEDDSIQEKWTIELRKGTAKVFKEDKTNQVKTTRTNGILMIPYSLITNFRKLGNLFFLIISIIMISDPDLTPYFRWIAAFPLFIYSIIHIIKVFYINYLRMREDKRVNTLLTRRAKEGTGDIEENIQWKSLKPGDIVYLKKEDVCPADIIILDTSLPKNRDSICWIDTQDLDGFSASIMRKAANATKVERSLRKGNYAEFRKILTGKVEYEPPNTSPVFSGYIKLKKDPRAETLSEENFVPRGSIIKNTDWVFGLVVYTGNDTRIMNYPRRSVNKGNFFDKLAQKFFLSGLAILFIFSIISIGIFKGQTRDLLMSIEYPEGLAGSNFILFIIMYSPLIPIAFYATVELFLLYQARNLKNKVKENDERAALKVLDPSALPNLGHVDYCLIDKTGTLTTSNYKVRAVWTNLKLYHMTPTESLKDKHKVFMKTRTLESAADHQLETNRDKAETPEFNTLQDIGDEPHEIGQSPERTYKFKDAVEENIQTSLLKTIKAKNANDSIHENHPRNFELLSLPTEGEENKDGPKDLGNDQDVILNTQESEGRPLFKKSPEGSASPVRNRFLQSARLEENSQLLSPLSARPGGTPFSGGLKTSNTQGKTLGSFDEIFDKKYDENDYILDCTETEDEDMLHFARSLAICHSVRSKYTDVEYLYESPFPEELPLVDLGVISGKTFLFSNKPDNPSKYTVKENGANVEYKILGVNDFSYGRNKFSIVAKSDEKGPAFIYAKGPAHSMRSSLQLDENEMKIYDTLVQEFQKHGHKVVVFATKDLDSNEEANFYKKYQSYKMSLYSQEVELETLAREVETGLRFMGMVILQDDLRAGSVEMIRNLQNADIKTWMVTGDNEENALNVAYLTSIIHQRQELHPIKFDNIEEGRTFIRNVLMNVKKHYEEEYGQKIRAELNAFKFIYKDKIVISINGDTLDVIWKDAYLKANFSFLCAISSSVIAYNLTPAHKKLLTLLIQNHFPDSPTVMAIGDGHNDKLMLQVADISFELKTNPEVTLQAADIQINSLSQIHSILFVQGREISDKTEKIINFMFYKSLLIATTIFFNNVFSLSAGTPLFDSMFVFLYSFLFTFVSPLIYGIFDISDPKDVLLAFPALYIDVKNKKKRAWINFCIQSLLEGFIHGIIVEKIVSYSSLLTMSSDGLTSNIGMKSLAQYYAIVVIVHVKLYGYFKAKKIIWALATISSLVSLLVYMFINDAAQFTDSDYLTETVAVFKRAGSLLGMIFVIVFCCTLNYLVRRLLKGRVFKTWYCYYAEKFTGKKLTRISNENILAEAQKNETLIKIVKSIYTQIELIDPVVQQMISPGNRSLGKLDMRRKTLTFADMRLERRYKMITADIASKRFRVIYLILLIVFGAYAIGASIMREDSGYTFSRLGVFLGFLVLGCFLFTKQYQTYYFEITFIFVLFVCAAKIAFDWTTEADSSPGAAIIPACIAIVFNTHVYWLYWVNLIYYIVYSIRLIVLFGVDDRPGFPEQTLIIFYILWSLIILTGAISIIISSLSYKFEEQQRIEFNSNRKLATNSNKNNEILSLLLPKFIKEKITALGNDKSLAEDQGEVAILFCDIMDFDKIIQSEGVNLVKILDQIFRAFDQLCGTHGIQKIETVGKTYMGCAGLKSCELGVAKHILSVHSVRRILNMAMNMDEFAKKVTYGNGIPMKLRVGIHYGRVIAGVIGYHKPQFSLIGDAVNTTSRVCTANNPGQIRMSDEAYQKMMENGGAGHSELHFIPKTEEMKGKGAVKVHIVARKSTNTRFKDKIGGVLKNKKKLIIANPIKFDKAVIAAEKPEVLKSRNTLLFKDIKESLAMHKEKIQISDPEKKAASKHKHPNDRSPTHDDDDDDDDEEQDMSMLKANTFTLKLAPHIKYKLGEFEDQTNTNNRKLSLVSIVVLLIVHLIQTGIYIALEENYPEIFRNYGAIVALRSIFAIALILLLIFDKTLIKNRFKGRVGLIVFIFGLATSVAQAVFTEEPIYHIIQTIELMLVYTVGIHAGGFTFLEALFFAAAMIIIFFVAYAVENMLGLINVFFFWILTFTNLIQKYIHIKDEIKYFNNINLRKKKNNEQDSLVFQLLPLHAAEIYFNDPTGRVDVSDEFKDVTILYADIKGFTDYSAGVEPKDVVTMLSALFTRFDKVCVQYLLYKVYTIGDCYVALSFYDASKRNPGKEVNNMVKMALSMIDIIREVRREVKFDGLDMRIGLHTGTIIGGVVGTDIIRYDIWGRDVLIANAMESEGEKGHINVSESTKRLLEAEHPDLYRFEPHKEVHMEKIQAKVPCYLLYSNNTDSQDLE